MPNNQRQAAIALNAKERFVRRRSVQLRRQLRRAYAGLLAWALATVRQGEIRKVDADPLNPFKFAERMRLISLAVSGTTFEAAWNAEAKVASDAGIKPSSVAILTRDVLRERYVRNANLQITGMAQADAGRVRELVARIVGGSVDSPGAAVAEIEETLSSQFRGRVDGIARNLVSEAYEKSRVEFWQSEAPGAAKRKRWIGSLGGEHDREHHNSIEDVDIDESFVVDSPQYGTIRMRHPNDYAYPGEAINCKCTTVILFTPAPKLPEFGIATGSRNTQRVR